MRSATVDHMGALLRRRADNGYERGLFDELQWARIVPRLLELGTWLENLRGRTARVQPQRRFSENDALCIAYPDHVTGPGDDAPARRLVRVFNRHLAGSYSRMHVLPHFDCPSIHPELAGPASRADGGFEPMGFQMSAAYGNPEDLTAVEAGLMFDFVLNHQSSRGEWFQGFLAGDPAFREHFIELSAEQVRRLDLSPIFRPRPHHPIVEHEGAAGVRRIWCTFSATQVDINAESPEVFVKLVEALVKDFIARGATWIRLDAVGYLVKKLGLRPGEPATSCFGIQETHAVVRALRCFLDEVAPDVTLVAEVNAPKAVIDTYYGDSDEAHLTYDFPAAPRSLWATHSGDASSVLEWARGRASEPDRIGLAFTASHDGIGVLPMADVSAVDGVDPTARLLAEIRRRGGAVNMKSKVVDGQTTMVPYEACITWTQAILEPAELDALRDDALDRAAIDRVASRLIASASYVLSGPHCVPAEYLGAIFCLLNDETTHGKTGHHRDKNRGPVDEAWLERAFVAPRTAHDKLVVETFARRTRLLGLRRRYEAFSPHARCEVGVADVRGAGPGQPVFSVLRHPPQGLGAQSVLCLTNASDRPQTVAVDPTLFASCSVTNLVDGREFDLRVRPQLELQPHEVAWISSGSGAHNDAPS